MRFAPENSVLLVIDVQGKLARVMHDSEAVLHQIAALIKAAHLLKIPILATEQVPDKIGETVSEIKQVLATQIIKKRSFSCCAAGDFAGKLSALKRKQIVICGIETHVCVYQTVCDLREEQYHVQVVADAVSSRTLANKEMALERIRGTGATLTSAEMIVCEWIKGADHPQFKEIMSLIK